MLRRVLAAGALLVGLLAGQVSPVFGASSPYTFTDPQGDATGPATDVVRVKLTHESTVTVAITMKDATGFGTWGTPGHLLNTLIYFKPAGCAAGWPLPGVCGYYICSSQTVALCSGESIVSGCPVHRSFKASKDRYTYKVARSCFGNPAWIKIHVLAGAFGAPSPDANDRAPDGLFHFTPRVKHG